MVAFIDWIFACEFEPLHVFLATGVTHFTFKSYITHKKAEIEGADTQNYLTQIHTCRSKYFDSTIWSVYLHSIRYNTLNIKKNSHYSPW